MMVGIKSSAEDAAWQVREAADEARWSLREATWRVEERVIWPGSDAAHKAIARALAAVEPLQRLIQTKLTWPLGDRLADYGTGARTAIATAAVVAASAAGVAGVQLAAPGGGDGAGAGSTLASAAEVEVATSPSTLSGVEPNFKRTASTAAAAQAVAPAEAGAKAKAPPARVALKFAEAFVQYEVGKVDDRTATTFSQVADEPLAKALAEDPPRLPESGEVPEAKVLNVVLGEGKGEELEASVSLVRLQAASELRLTLIQTPKGWQVAEVRG